MKIIRDRTPCQKAAVGKENNGNLKERETKVVFQRENVSPQAPSQNFYHDKL